MVRQKVWWLVRGVKRKKSAAGGQIRQGEVVRQAGEVVSDFFVHAPWRRSVVAHFSCYVVKTKELTVQRRYSDQRPAALKRKSA